MTVFNKLKSNHLNRTAFFDTPVDIARYDMVKYPQFKKLTEKQLGFFWKPEEVDLSRDGKDFSELSEHEQHIFTSNLKRQILLDSVQGRAPTMALLPICSLPELENWIQTWTFSETIHSLSYTHVIRNVYPNPSVVFDEMLDIPEIMDCATDISKYYDELIELNEYRSGSRYAKLTYTHKEALWMCLNAINALEGIRFYVSFACSWAFAELKKMEGNAKIIKLIARDENLHLAGTQQLLKLLPQDDKDFEQIRRDCAGEVRDLFRDVVLQEKAWAKYLFNAGSIIGLNERLLCDYVDWIAAKRMTAIGVEPFTKSGSNALPWTQKWIGGAEVQVAPQETEITSYVIGAVKNDVQSGMFKGMSL